jgi:hypothetical protein
VRGYPRPADISSNGSQDHCPPAHLLSCNGVDTNVKAQSVIDRRSHEDLLLGSKISYPRYAVDSHFLPSMADDDNEQRVAWMTARCCAYIRSASVVRFRRTLSQHVLCHIHTVMTVAQIATTIYSVDAYRYHMIPVTPETFPTFNKPCICTWTRS